MSNHQAAVSQICLLSCVSSKADHPLPARDLYTSALFVKARAYIESMNCPWFILSAEHGLVHPSTVVAPYEKTLNTMGVRERRGWADGVIRQMQTEMPYARRIVVLAGQRYRDYLMPYLATRAARVDVPLEGKRIGEQVQWLSSPPIARADDLVRFYELLGVLEQKLGGKRTLATCSGWQDWPHRGVYFFFEPGETRSDSGIGPRVVRVGTHALKPQSATTLWKRLSQHRGTARSGGGNHRGSIFRLLVGEALLRRDHPEALSSWGRGADPATAAATAGVTAQEAAKRIRARSRRKPLYLRHAVFMACCR
jgi:hypothetical protein